MKKPCRRCFIEKPLSEFTKHPGCKFGVNSICKICQYKQNAEYLKTHREKILSYWRKYHHKDKAKRNMARREIYKRMYSNPESREKIKQAVYKSRRDNPLKWKARNAVQYALSHGKLFRAPCEKCGTKKANAHHPDYSKPLDVKWLCRKCHGLEHALIQHPAEAPNAASL